MLSPLVLAPLVTREAASETTDRLARRLLCTSGELQPLAALLLLASVARPPSPSAMYLALPWLMVTMLLAMGGAARVCRRGLRPLPDLTCDAGLLFVPVGGVSLCLWRAGISPLGFDPVIVMLTAIHFHYAELILPLLAGWSGRAAPGRFANAVALGVLTGVPAVAAGIVATQLRFSPVLEVAAATWLPMWGMGTAVLKWIAFSRSGASLPARGLAGLSSLALVATMTLAVLYGWRSVHHWPWLDIPWMRAWHGTLNAIVACFCGVCGHLLRRHALRSDRSA